MEFLLHQQISPCKDRTPSLIKDCTWVW